MSPTVRHLPYTIDPSRDRSAFYETWWKKVALELLARHVDGKGRSLLDYGSGRGETLGMAKELGFSVQGTDVDPTCVELSSKFGPATLLNPDDPLAQFGEKSFDVVTCFHVLEHVDNPKRILTMLGRIARSHVVIAVPNLRYLHGLTRRKVDLSIVNEGHLHSWDHWHFLNLAERHCGLKLVEWGYDATILPLVSQATDKLFGSRAAIALETGLFRRLFPLHGISIIGLFGVPPYHRAPGPNS